MYKSFFRFVLIFVAAFTLVACGNKGQPLTLATAAPGAAQELTGPADPLVPVEVAKFTATVADGYTSPDGVTTKVALVDGTPAVDSTAEIYCATYLAQNADVYGSAVLTSSTMATDITVCTFTVTSEPTDPARAATPDTFIQPVAVQTFTSIDELGDYYVNLDDSVANLKNGEISQMATICQTPGMILVSSDPAVKILVTRIADGKTIETNSGTDGLIFGLECNPGDTLVFVNNSWNIPNQRWNAHFVQFNTADYPMTNEELIQLYVDDEEKPLGLLVTLENEIQKFSRK